MSNFLSPEIIDKITSVLIKKLTEKEKQIILKQYGECSFQVIRAEVSYILTEKKEIIEQKKEVNFSFLYTIVRNYFQDKFLKGRIQHILKEKSLPEFSGKSISRSVIAFLFAEEMVEIVANHLSSKELETLCWMMFNKKYPSEENPFLSALSREAKYKRWNRLKPKLNSLFKEYGSLNEEEFVLFCELYMSKICKKFRLKG
ncbi:hypothetical protein [Desulfurobacterium sp. TC5-1]|uniref:hypothetical protein n=1 Tax=Desulfurobacterium sp. TC5-1 TaxID=1158318 RepID=UPI0003B59CDC|nr:hypothetical protein [Desulfurobacterium sp. TC5-1]